MSEQVKKVNWQLPIQTRDGRPVRDPMICYSPRGLRMYSVAYGANGEVVVGQDGSMFPDTIHPMDIINTPAPPIEVEIGDRYLNVYRNHDMSINFGGPHDSLNAARKIAGTNSRYLGPAKLPTTLTLSLIHI